MQEITATAGGAVTSLDRLAVEIRFYDHQGAQCAIEIGKRLIEAKKQVPHGEWGKWLKENFDYSQENARRFMQCAERFSNSTTSCNLTQSQMFELLALPARETQKFIEAKADAGTPVEDMTVKNLREEVKTWKERALTSETARIKADERSADTEKQMGKMQERMNKLQEELRAARQNAAYAPATNVEDDPKYIELQEELTRVRRKYGELQTVKGQAEALNKCLVEINALPQEVEAAALVYSNYMSLSGNNIRLLEEARNYLTRLYEMYAPNGYPRGGY